MKRLLDTLDVYIDQAQVVHPRGCFVAWVTELDVMVENHYRGVLCHMITTGMTKVSMFSRAQTYHTLNDDPLISEDYYTGV